MLVLIALAAGIGGVVVGQLVVRALLSRGRDESSEDIYRRMSS